MTSRTSTAVGERLTVRLVADGVEFLETTLALVHGMRRLEVVQRLVKRATADKESVYFTFPFAVERPSASYELIGGRASPGKPAVPGSARHVNVIRHWIAIEDPGVTLAWSSLEAALVQFGGIHAPFPPYGSTVNPDPGMVVSWAMNNVWDTNFPIRQGGEARFAYAVASAEPGTAGHILGARTAVSLTQPLIGIIGAFAGDTGSFCSFDRDDVELIGLSASASGHAFAIRLRSHADEHIRLRVEFPELRIQRALAGTFYEEGLTDVTRGSGAQLELEPGELTVLAVDLRPT